MSAIKYPGVAKFGIALEWGSRGRWFESSHSDQENRCFRKEMAVFSYFSREYQHEDVFGGNKSGNK